MRNLVDKLELKKHMMPLLLLTGFVMVFALVCVVRILRGRQVDYWFFACLGMIVTTIILIYVMYYALFMKKAAFYKCYFIVSLVVGIFFMFIIPPYATPDELTHMWSTYYVSNEIMGYEDPTEARATLLVRECELNAEKNGVFNRYLSREAYNNLLSNMFKIEDDAGNEIVNSYHGYSTPHMLYFVPAIGVVIGRLLSLGVVPSALLATLLNKLLFVFASTYSIKKIPFGKMILAGVCLLPMTLQQTSSTSYDCPLLAASVVVIALGIRWAFTDEPMKNTEMIVYLIGSIFLVAGKSGVYGLYCLLPVLYKGSREKLVEVWKKYKKQIVICIAVVAGIWLISKGIEYVSELNAPPVQPLEPTKEELEAAKYENYIVWAKEEGYTISYFLQNPVELVRIIMNTLSTQSDYYFTTLYGHSLGWLVVPLPLTIIMMYAFLGLISAFSLEGDRFLSIKDKAGLGICGLISCGLCAAAMLLYWTPRSFSYIAGVQGRYFLPAYLGWLFCFGGSEIRFRKNIDRELLFITVLLSAMTILSLLKLN